MPNPSHDTGRAGFILTVPFGVHSSADQRACISEHSRLYTATRGEEWWLGWAARRTSRSKE